MLGDLRARHPELLDAIRTERRDLDGTEKALKFLDDFARTFA